MDKKPITPEGQQRLRTELDQLKNVKRQEIVDAISEARAHGDLKENAEYHAAREEQGLNEARIRELEDVLSTSQVVEYKQMGVEDRVIFGSTVTIKDIENDEIKKYVWASSETVLGLPFDTYPPYVPVDEEYYPRPESSYSLSKVMGEEMARQYCRRNPEMKIFGLRYSNIMEEKDYKQFQSFQKDPFLRKWNFWGYIDARDVAQACLLAMESKLKGAENFIIAADDTVMEEDNKSLLDKVFPNIKIKGEIGKNKTLLSNDKAKKILGFKPEYSWKNIN